MKWFRQNWPFLTLGFILVIAVGFFVAFWKDSNRLASLGSLFGFIIAALLVAITTVYVHYKPEDAGATSGGMGISE